MSLADPFVVVLVYLMCTHFWGDFVMQTHWMATNKSKSIKALSAHVGVYTGFIAVFALSVALGGYMTILGAGAFIAINSVLHFMTDFCTSRITSRYWSQGKLHEFFVVVGLDQLLHFVFLFISLVVFYEVIHG